MIQARLAMDAEEEDEEGKVEWFPTPVATTSCCDPREESSDCCCSSSKGGRGGSKLDLRWMLKKKKRGKWSGLPLSLQQK